MSGFAHDLPFGATLIAPTAPAFACGRRRSNSVAVEIEGQPAVAMTPIARRLVRSRGPLRRRHALSLPPGRRPRGARSRVARPGRRCPRPEPRRRSARLSLAASGVARPAVARDGALRAACRRSGRLQRRAGSLARARGARRHRRRADADQRFSRPAQLGLRRRAAVCARPQLWHAGRPEGAGRRRAWARAHDLSRRRLQSLRARTGIIWRPTRRGFFRDDIATPWGAAIDFRRPEVRRFFTENALYWLLEYRFDGLRFDAVHAISEADWLDEMAAEVRAAVEPGRHVHLVLEHDGNVAAHLRGDFDAQWNDDAHHVLHVLLTRRARRLLFRLCRGAGRHAGALPRRRASPIRASARPIARASRAARRAMILRPPPSCSSCRTTTRSATARSATVWRTHADPEALEAAIALQLLCPQIPLIFMGEEGASRSPFLYFTDHHGELAKAVREGRRREFAGFEGFEPGETADAIPDPNAAETFRTQPAGCRWRAGQAQAGPLRRVAGVAGDGPDAPARRRPVHGCPPGRYCRRAGALAAGRLVPCSPSPAISGASPVRSNRPTAACSSNRAPGQASRPCTGSSRVG